MSKELDSPSSLRKTLSDTQVIQSASTESSDKPFFNFVDDKYFSATTEEVFSLLSIYNQILNDGMIMENVCKCLPNSIGSSKYKLQLLLFNDLLNSLNNIGYDMSTLATKEGMPIVYLYLFTEDVPIELIHDSRSLSQWMNENDKYETYCLSQWLSFKHDKPLDYFYIKEVLESSGRSDLAVRYFNCLYRLFTYIIKADNIVTTAEKNWLEMLSNRNADSEEPETNTIHIDSSVDLFPSPTQETEEDETERFSVLYDDMIEEMDYLVSLDSVKAEIYKILDSFDRTKYITYRFIGEQGTGKRTIARILSNLLYSKGKSNGRFSILSVEGFSKDFSQQTSQIKSLFDNSRCGVLYIERPNGFDKLNPAVSSLLENQILMNYQNTTIVFGGTADDFSEYFDKHSALSKIPEKDIVFPCYSKQEMLHIFLSILNNNGFEITDEAGVLIYQYIDSMYQEDKDSLINARSLSALCDSISKNHTSRLVSDPNATECLKTIDVIDITEVLGLELEDSNDTTDSSQTMPAIIEYMSDFEINDYERQSPTKKNTINIKVSLDELSAISSGEKTWDSVVLTEKNYKKYLKLDNEDPYFDPEISNVEDKTWGINTFAKPCPFVPKDDLLYINYYTGVLKDNVCVLVELDDFSLFPVINKEQTPLRYSVKDGKIVLDPEGPMCEWNFTFGFHVKTV